VRRTGPPRQGARRLRLEIRPERDHAVQCQGEGAGLRRRREDPARRFRGLLGEECEEPRGPRRQDPALRHARHRGETEEPEAVRRVLLHQGQGRQSAVGRETDRGDLPEPRRGRRREGAQTRQAVHRAEGKGLQRKPPIAEEPEPGLFFSEVSRSSTNSSPTARAPRSSTTTAPWQGTTSASRSTAKTAWRSGIATVDCPSR
jgi:hypothetical protein